MTVGLADPIDLAGVYLLISGVPVVARDDRTVQIGGEPPHWLLLQQAPENAVQILRHLDGTSRVRDVLRAHSADPALWQELLTRLRDAHFLVEATEWTFPGVPAGPLLEPERDSLVHRHGVAVARRILQARQDAVVVVRGGGRIASAVAGALAASGVGHVHQQPDRDLRISGLPESERADTAALAANLRLVAPAVRVHAPAAHHQVDLVILCGDGPPAPSLAAELTAAGIPHLAVRAGLISAVVGPFVLPGRSACLMCATRQRTDVDVGWPTFQAGLRREPIVPPARLVCAAAALAISDALDQLDGATVPSTLGGTVEWTLGQLGPRRRSWSMHPECGCRRGRPAPE